MSVWTHLPKNMLSSNEAYFLRQYPQYVVKAFLAVHPHDYAKDSKEDEWRTFPYWITKSIQAFQLLWGGLDEAAFLRAFRQGSDQDRLLALFALGQSEFPQASDWLAPFLQSTDQLECWVTACVLGLKRDERALPLLQEFLLWEPPIDKLGRLVKEVQYWYRTYYFALVRLLAIWGPPTIIATLRAAFLHQVTHTKGNTYYSFLKDALCYALGRRGAIGALHGIPLVASDRCFSLVFIALGYIQADERFEDIENEIQRNRRVQEEVVQVLVEHFALSEQESWKEIESFQLFYEERRKAKSYKGPETEKLLNEIQKEWEQFFR